MDSKAGFSHRPVLLREVVELLAPESGRVYVDGTLGGGGHAKEVLKASAPDGRLIGIDRDLDAIEAATVRLKAYSNRTDIVRANFIELRSVLDSLEVDKVDGILLDLGVSTHQLTSPTRGFSFRADSRLDMRMDARAKLDAFIVVNTYEEAGLERMFRVYGQERFSARIARAIVRARSDKAVEGTRALAEIIVGAIPARFHGRKTHPATKVFQAIRLAVNDEMESLRAGIAVSVAALAPFGRLAIISFHSLEDRMVKRAFNEMANPCTCPPRAPGCVCGKLPTVRLLTRRGIKPSEPEVEENPKARSARLRGIEKI